MAEARSLETLVRSHADEAETARRLPEPVAQAFAESGLYRIAAPEDLGGMDADPLTQMAVIEAVSAFDGAAGWNLMIGIETFGLLAPACERCRELIEEPSVVMASSTAAVGRADRDAEGYRIKGRWQFVSGCHNAQVFGATVQPFVDGVAEGRPCYAMITAPDFRIEDTWHVGGLRGSGSHDVVVDGVWIPESRMVAPLGGARASTAQLRFPLGARLAFNKVAVAMGIARAGIDAFVDLAIGKVPRFSRQSLRERPASQRAVAEAEVSLLAGRALVMDRLSMMWEQVLGEAHISTRERALFQLACSDAVRRCVAAVDWVCDAAGTTANDQSSPLERIARDVRVVRQHLTVASHHIDDAGRVLLGLEPQGMMLAGLSEGES